jgi:hypothetical protein
MKHLYRHNFLPVKKESLRMYQGIYIICLKDRTIRSSKNELQKTETSSKE